MTESVIPWLQQLGAAGAVLVAAGVVIRHILHLLTEAQEKRVQDAQAATAKLLELVQKQHEQAALYVQAIDGNVDAIREMRLLLDQYGQVFSDVRDFLIANNTMRAGTSPRHPFPTTKR